MAYSISHEELLKKVQRDPDAAVAKQLLISANSTCAIISKRMLGIFDRQDQLQLSAETFSAIKYLAEHDYLAYLVFLERFDLIREIFWQKELFAQQLALVDELEKEKEAEKKQRLLLSEQERLSSLTRRQQEQLVREQEQRLQEERTKINVDLYSYYTQLKQQIHHNFHVRQIDILGNAYKGRIERINRAVTIFQNDSSIALEDKQALTKLQHDYKKEYEAVQRIPIHKPDASIDSVALRKKTEVAKRVDDKFKHQLGVILRKYPKHEQLTQINREESDAIQAYEGELTHNEKQREQRLSEIRPHLEKTRRIAKADLEQSMGTSIDCLKECDLVGFSDNTQCNAFKDSVKKLDGYRIELIQTDDDARVKELTNLFASELILVNKMVKLSMLPPDKYQKLQRDVRVLSELNMRINTNTAALSSAKAAGQPPTYTQTVQNDPPSPFYSQAIEELSLYDDLARQNPTSGDKIQQDQSMAHHTSRYGGRMFAHRKEGVQNQQEIQPDLNRSLQPQTEQTVEFDTQHQNTLAKDLLKLEEKLNFFNKNSGLSIEGKQLIIDSKRLCEEITPIARGQVAVARIELLKNNLEKLTENYSELDDFVDNLNSIISSYSDSPRP